MFVFTKLNTLVDSIINTLEEGGEDSGDDALIIQRIQIVLDKFKKEAKDMFHSPIFFLYDPLVKNYYADEEFKIYSEEGDERYLIGKSGEIIRKRLKEVLEKGVAITSVTHKLKDIYQECIDKFKNLKSNVMNE